MAEVDVAGAKAVLQKFVNAGLARDEPTMRACLTEKSLTANFNPDAGPPPGSDIQLGEPAVESDEAVVIPVLGREPGGEYQPMLQALVVKEAGEWKVDLATTMDRMMGGMMDNLSETLTDTLGGVMEGVGSAISGALDAFGSTDEEEPQDWSHADLKPRRDELLPLPKMTRLPKLSAALSEAVGSPVTAVAAMDDLLMGDQTQFQTLLDWFESTLFAGWPDVLRVINETNPLAGRLSALRLEAAGWHDQKCLVLDGSDLLYRMRLPENKGFYPDDWINWLLAGVLAGLFPGIDKNVRGKRLILSDEEYGNLDTYKERVAPAYMRRISELLEKPIRLNVDWDGLHDPATAVRQFQRWGLNRIYGAIALACQEDDTKARLSEELTTIELVRASGIEERAAGFEDGILKLSFHDFGGEPVGFYEQALYNVLVDEPIIPDDTQALTGAEAAAGVIDTSYDDTPNIEPANESAIEPPTEPVDEFAELRRQQEADAAKRAETKFTVGKVAMRIPTAEEIEALKVLAKQQPSTSLNNNNNRNDTPPEEQHKPTKVDLEVHATYGTPEPTDWRESKNEKTLYPAAQRFVEELELTLQRNGLYPFQSPPDPLEVKGAFGCENLAFEQWLAWVFIPRIRDIIATQGQFPEHSQVGAYAVRALDGRLGANDVITLLSDFDQTIDSHSSRK